MITSASARDQVHSISSFNRLPATILEGRPSRTQTCHTCGLPSSACSADGFTTRITIKATNGYQRDRTSTIWCCSRLCAVIAQAMSEMGPVSHRWPISLKEHVAERVSALDIREVGAVTTSQDRSGRAETIAEARIDTGAKNSETESTGLDTVWEVSVRKRPGGRPRGWGSEAERLRAYRATKRETVDSPTPIQEPAPEVSEPVQG